MTTSVLAPAFQSPPPTRYNAVRHGLLSRYVVLPWENRDEYETLLRELMNEYEPMGPTETHLVEELAGIFWRKRRLRIAELATYRKALHNEAISYDGTEDLAGAALMGITGQTKSKASLPAALASGDTKSELRDIRRDKAMTTTAWGILQKGGPDAYEMALAALREDTRTYWGECLEDGGTDLEPTAEALRGWIDEHWREWFEDPIAELEHRDTIREQAFGIAYTSDKLDTLARYETHLDRKFERTLSTLLRLCEFRKTSGAAGQ